MEKGTNDTSEPATSTSGYRTEYGDRAERCGNQRIEAVHGVFPLAVDKLEPGRSPSIKNGTGNHGQVEKNYKFISSDCLLYTSPSPRDRG